MPVGPTVIMNVGMSLGRAIRLETNWILEEAYNRKSFKNHWIYKYTAYFPILFSEMRTSGLVET